jgi:hypothetical protein
MAEVVQLDIFTPALERVVELDCGDIRWDALILGKWHRAVASSDGSAIALYVCRSMADRYLGNLERIYSFPDGCTPEQAAEAITGGVARESWPHDD